MNVNKRKKRGQISLCIFTKRNILKQRKKLRMIKTCCLLFVFFIASLDAQELISLLKSVQNNHTLHMKYLQQPFVCKPYGVVILSELMERTDLSSSCKNFLSRFRAENPQEKYFAASRLKIEQQYSVESIKGLCLLHLSSEHSYSEALLEQGYALIVPEGVKDDEVLEKRFDKALLRAKNTKAGIWSDSDARNCFQRSLK